MLRCPLPERSSEARRAVLRLAERKQGSPGEDHLAASDVTIEIVMREPQRRASQTEALRDTKEGFRDIITRFADVGRRSAKVHREASVPQMVLHCVLARLDGCASQAQCDLFASLGCAPEVVAQARDRN